MENLFNTIHIPPMTNANIQCVDLNIPITFDKILEKKVEFFAPQALMMGFYDSLLM